ncbi:acetyltransferase [Coprinopsis cinerea okayama7|uniref:Acetyltransferase n=1 Tax=Coprinopsis cinerea (strain Okayama-7 / 130 / ATCC MYA-4618 / FGSC 9003) TaxID=240176 RepID=A8N395_COPC7|nr:acetyltransferase [Coprinopsis cinerea okayama7\|eukprot:XP_001829340.1 acetyltransferase [Coprinopsis cinerea okayama7\
MLTSMPPIERHPITGEMILRLRKHPNLILTPPRESDVPKLAEYLSDPRISSFLASPPIPYRIEHAQAWLARAISERGAVVEEIESKGSGPFTGCPFQFIRQLKGDGSDEMIGAIHLVPWPKGRVPDVDDLRESGSSVTEVIWTIGNWLTPALHGQGIMTNAVETILHDWGVPWMDVRKVIVGAFIENPASVKVFEKNGFKTWSIVENALEVRGEMKGLHTLLWTRNELSCS